MLLLIENGEVYSPDYLGQTSILLGAEKVLQIGPIDKSALDTLALPFTIIDAGDVMWSLDLLIPINIYLAAAAKRALHHRPRFVTVNTSFTEAFLNKSNRTIHLKGSKVDQQ